MRPGPYSNCSPTSPFCGANLLLSQICDCIKAQTEDLDQLILSQLKESTLNAFFDIICYPGNWAEITNFIIIIPQRIRIGYVYTR